MDVKVSAHLCSREIACHDARSTPYPRKYAARLVLLTTAFEAVRTAAGDKPLRVLSCYRTAAHNKRVGGAATSQHVKGNAIDLATPAGMSTADFHNTVRALARRVKVIGGVGYYRWGVHVDTRPRVYGRVVGWKGRAVMARDWGGPFSPHRGLRP